MAEEMVDVTALGTFPSRGKIIKPGPAKVPAKQVARLLAKKLIAPLDGVQDASTGGSADAERTEAAIARIGGSLAVEHVSGESAVDFLERLADKVKGQSSDELPADFPMRDLLTESGYASLESVKQASDEELLAIDGIGEARLKEIRRAVK